MKDNGPFIMKFGISFIVTLSAILGSTSSKPLLSGGYTHCTQQILLLIYPSGDSYQVVHGDRQ